MKTTKTKAFTLLELLIAVALAAIVAAGGFALMASGLRAKSTASSAISAKTAALAAGDIIVKALSCATKPDGTLSGSFDGESDEISFYYATNINADALCDIRRINFTAEEISGSENQRLVMTTWANHLSPKTLDGASAIITRNIQSVEYKYFDGDSWFDSWDSASNGDELPVAVSVTISYLDGSRQMSHNHYARISAGGSTSE